MSAEQVLEQVLSDDAEDLDDSEYSNESYFESECNSDSDSDNSDNNKNNAGIVPATVGGGAGGMPQLMGMALLMYMGVTEWISMEMFSPSGQCRCDTTGFVDTVYP